MIRLVSIAGKLKMQNAEGKTFAFCVLHFPKGDRRDSNPRHPGPQPGALPTELRPPSNLDRPARGAPERRSVHFYAIREVCQCRPIHAEHRPVIDSDETRTGEQPAWMKKCAHRAVCRKIA